MCALEEESGPVYMLVNVAGGAVCGKLEDTSAADIQVTNRKFFHLDFLHRA